MANSPFQSAQYSVYLIKLAIIGCAGIQGILLMGANVAYADTIYAKDSLENRQSNPRLHSPSTAQLLPSSNSSPSSSNNAFSDDTRANNALPRPAFSERLRQISNAIFVPPREGAPRDTATAGSREEDWCTGDAMPMRSLMPENEYALTFASRPTVSIAMPTTQAEQVVLLFETEAGEIHSQSYLPIPEQIENSIVQFQLTDTMPELSIGQPYRWSLAVICNQALDPSDPLFRGWVTRTARSTEADHVLTNASIMEQVAWLSKQGYWNEMLSLLLAHPDLGLAALRDEP